MNTNIIVNGKQFTKDSEMLFSDLIKSMASEFASDSQVISEIRVNGSTVDESEEASLSMRSIGKIGSIELNTSDTLDLAYEALETAKQFIKQIVPLSKKVGNLYLAGDINGAEKSFIVLVDNLERLTELMSSVQYVLKGRIKVSVEHDSTFRIAQVRLVSAIQELLPAKLDNKIPLLADILRVELPEALSEMRELGIPVLQRKK